MDNDHFNNTRSDHFDLPYFYVINKQDYGDEFSTDRGTGIIG